MNEPRTQSNSWAALLVIAGSYFCGLAVYRIVDIEPFPSVSFPAFTSSDGLRSDPQTLWAGADDDIIEWGGTDIRGGAEAAIRRTLIRRTTDGSLSRQDALWALEVTDLDVEKGCRLEVRSAEGIAASIDFGPGCQG